MGQASLRPFIAFLAWLVLGLLYALGAGAVMAHGSWPAVRAHSLAVLRVRGSRLPIRLRAGSGPGCWVLARPWH